MSSASRTLVSRLATLPATACRRAQPSRTSPLISWASNSTCQTLRRNVAQKIATPQSLLVPQRGFSTTMPTRHGHIDPPKPGEELYVTFIEKDGQEHKFAVSAGDNLLDIAQANDVEMEGACGGSCACSTCHVIVTDEDYYDRIPEPEDDENDMLDLAFGLTETSRLGCQVKMTKELDGLVVKLPSMTRNLQASDFQ
ncbi:mitochondrial matrix iron-sulfur protein [Claviceps pusilla]|uniref:Mitochondrial matrix iron-sulfur protein n=1 Tax=Claviceps pusilla TaxID=123648 RepID=A0A9P7SXR1_9HYPO|nr:mitochondrial matrix iron-sulfur protein [Claviceps pusilla]